VTASSMINLSYELQKGLNEGAVFQQIAERIPYFPIFEPDGSLTVEIAGRQNPLAEALKTKRDNRNFRVQNFNFLQFKILPSLDFKSTLDVNFRFNKLNNFDPTIVQTPGRPPTGNEETELSYDFQHEDYFTFKKQFGKHKIAAIAGWQIQRWNSEGSNLSAVAFSSDNIETFNNVAELNVGSTVSDKSRHSLAAIFGDLSYDFKGKYLLKGTLRRDGSSRFGSDKRYGLFPLGSIGWRISEEKFLKNVKAVDNLMVRYSFGANGNERIGNYESRLLYRPGARYNGLNGISTFQLSNPLLGWENTKSQNLGLDLMMYRNRVGLTLDLWDKTTQDLLYSVPIPEETGFSNIRRNIGLVQNKGIDINISLTPIRSKNFEWNSSFNITFLRNKVLELADEDGFQSGNFFIQEGQPLGNMFGYRKLGVFQYDESNAFDANGTQLTPIFNDGGTFQKYQLNGSDYTGTVNKLKVGVTTLRGGDIIWEDRNKDFLIEGVNDRGVIGNGLPTHFGGFFNEFKYKSVSLSFLFDYNFGNDIFRNYDQGRNDLNSANETPAPNVLLTPG
jgi:TonB-dependent starch-binding outer membrane protein SusC